MMPVIMIEPWSISCVSEIDDFCESIFFIGNGYLGMRGYPGWERKKQPGAHAIFRAGLFSRINHNITDMVQLPDVTTLCPESEPITTVGQKLDLRTGITSYHWETLAFRFILERTVCMSDSQLILVKLTATAKKAGILSVQSIADAAVKNLPVNDDQMIESKDFVQLLEIDCINFDELKMHTIEEQTPISISWQIISDYQCARTDCVEQDNIITTFSANLDAGESWVLEKRIRILAGGEAPNKSAGDPWQSSREVWDSLWGDCDIEIESDDAELQGAIRYNIFQLLCNNASKNSDVSIGARGLTHGRYKGNTFWDTEILLLPFYMWTRHEAARNLLLYRFSHLGDAKALAAKQNLDGARFPWMCSSDGTEQCESWDIGLCEVHITADIAYAMDRYVQTTGDESFLKNQAVAVYLETARYWLSRLTWEPGKQRFSCFFVKGPDEYCGAAVNNTYTNWMARNNILLAVRYCDLNGVEHHKLSYAADRITLLYDTDRKLFLQDEIFERLEPAPFLKASDEPTYKAVCFDRMQRYRVIKQADLVLLMVLFPNDFTREDKENVFKSYEPLTLHDSSLSWGIHGLLAARLGMWEKADYYLSKAIFLDLKNLMQNTGHEGIHLAALGAAWQAVVYGMAGVWADENGLSVSPMLPPNIHRLRFKVQYQGERYDIEIEQGSHQVRKEVTAHAVSGNWK